MNGVLQYFREVRGEMAKVTWPKRDEIIKLTAIVLVISAMVGAYVGALDFIFTTVLETIISR